MVVRVLFDQAQPNVTIADEDPNYYALGRIGEHNVVAVCLPHGLYGTNAVTDVASNMRRSFRSLKFCLLNDIRLGDVVVSIPSGKYSGVLPYDMIKTLEAGASQLNGYLFAPPQTLMCAISELDCDAGYVVQRTERISPQQSRVFYGLIASGNQLMRSAHERDKLGKEHNVLCFEMEGAGIMNSFPCLIIRGICDYADSHKNKVWQNHASATAAASAKLLLSRLHQHSSRKRPHPRN
ncbi:nucleoside phosphorylase domain-containing protein [Aspergillus cavernicola]|uniref:Nucleoside phosphorylase domain-containing protein n=1 Tax=Aspergillus cavernicola TaxID=176166 RepID=A0ABR4HXM6_9EURO